MHKGHLLTGWLDILTNSSCVVEIVGVNGEQLFWICLELIFVVCIEQWMVD